MSLSLHSLDRMIAAERAHTELRLDGASTKAGSKRGGTTKVPPWKRSAGGASVGSYASRQRGMLSGNSYTASARTTAKAGDTDTIDPATLREMQQLQKKLDAMRRKMVKDRAQANSTIAALRAEKESAQSDHATQLERLTKARKRTESALATKISGLEQEVQKLRSQSRTRAKRRKEQEKVR